MLKYLKDEANKTKTENGGATYESTSSDCLDLFASIGALRRESDGEIEARFLRAFTEDREIAMKLLFFARDIRGGLGERRVFRVILRWLAEHEPECVRQNVAYIAEYGRYDDLLFLMGTPAQEDMISFLRTEIAKDLQAMQEERSVSLLAKWLPSVNASSPETVRSAKRIARALGMTDATYRKTLVALRKRIRIIENNLRERDYTFSYAEQPSKAMYKYRAAFLRNDKKRYTDFIGRVNEGKEKLHADTIAPYELIEPYLSYYWGGKSFMRSITKEEELTLNATWKSLPDFGTSENMLAVIDTSGSMYMEEKPMPGAVALSLGIYLAEHNTGAYAGHFIEFSERPQLIELKGKTFASKLRYAASFNEIGNTNLQAVFDLILKSAVKNGVDQSELPTKLIIISDMEFDACVEKADATNFESAKAKFQSAGYRLPEVVFWNVASRNRQQPVTKNEQGVALVSGCTPRLFSMIASGTMSPYTFMMEIVNSERYAPIRA